MYFIVGLLFPLVCTLSTMAQEPDVNALLENYFKFVAAHDEPSRVALQRRRAHNIGECLRDHAKWSGSIKRAGVQKRFAEQSIAEQCDALMFFGDLYYEKRGDSGCSEMAADMTLGKYDPWLQGHVWKEFVSFPFTRPHYGNFARMASEHIFNAAKEKQNKQV